MATITLPVTREELVKEGMSALENPLIVLALIQAVQEKVQVTVGDDHYDVTITDPKFSDKAIAAKHLYDAHNCEILIALGSSSSAHSKPAAHGNPKMVALLETKYEVPVAPILYGQPVHAANEHPVLLFTVGSQQPCCDQQVGAQIDITFDAIKMQLAEPQQAEYKNTRSGKRC